jgi:(p)ppGpp synthase/HD superfamily hydrolase
MTEGVSPEILPSPTFELELKNKTQDQLLELIFEQNQHWSDDDRLMVNAAHHLAEQLHTDDSHRDLPYPYHYLRNAARASGYLEVHDPEVITAIILHDTVEDHPDDILKIATHGTVDAAEGMPVPDDPYAKQQVGLKTIEALFTPRVAELVATVTNPPESEDNLSYDEKLDRYHQKVASAVATTDGWLIKFVDWVDNAVGIIHSEGKLPPDRLAHFKRKYGLVLPLFEARFQKSDLQEKLSDQAKVYVLDQFRLGRERLTLAA